MVGTLVGRLIATDPDGNAVTFSLVNGEGDTYNSLFTLETNGTLRTATIFDFESNASVYSIRVRAEDESGSSIEDSFTISLEDLDDQVPVLALIGDANLTHEAGTLFQDPGASWTDNTDGSGKTFGLGEVNARQPGEYQLIYHYTDQAGNSATSVIRTVTVVDTVSAIITLKGTAQISIEAGTDYLDGGATWTDAVDGNGTLLAQGELKSLVPGLYVLRYDYTDEAGNQSETVTRTVMVKDTTPPVISLNGSAEVTIEAGTEYQDEGASWSDLVDGTGTVDAKGTVKHRVPGVYSLTYRKTDQAGNRSERVTRTVTVVNDDPDSLTLSANKVEENLPKGRAVGRFSWSDPNDPEGRGEYTIQIINEEAKALFRIDDNHTLLTRVPLDYESNSSHLVVIRVADAYGGAWSKALPLK